MTATLDMPGPMSLQVQLVAVEPAAHLPALRQEAGCCWLRLVCRLQQRIAKRAQSCFFTVVLLLYTL